MSDQSSTVEFVGPGDGSGSGGARRGTAFIAVVALVLVVVLGGGAFAVYKVFFSGGPQPAEALPADTLGFVSIDLNPSAGQKVAAIRTIRKFPALKKELGLKTDDDLRRWVFDKATEDGSCKGLDYNRDVEPWLGKRAAFAAVELDGDAAPAVALQVTDAAKAKKGVAKVVDACGGPGDDFGFATGSDYLIISDSTAHAKAVVAAAKQKSLAQDAAYRTWMDKVGDAGVVSFYASKQGAEFLAKQVAQFDQGFTHGFNDSFEGNDLPSGSGADQEAAMKEAFRDFKGMAGTLRFADGGMELSMVGGGMSSYTGTTAVGKEVGNLPKDTAVALAFSVPKDFVTTMLDQLRTSMGDEVDQGISQLESQTGLAVPEDVQTLLGKSISISLGGDAPDDLTAVRSPAEVPFGLVIAGDVDRIKGVISKLESSSGQSLEDLQVAQQASDGKIAFASSDDYAKALLDDGSLGEDSVFKKAVPHAGKASSVFFVDFDSDWLDRIVDAAGSEADASEVSEVKDNLEPLESLGLSAWADDDTSHFLLKVTTD